MCGSNECFDRIMKINLMINTLLHQFNLFNASLLIWEKNNDKRTFDRNLLHVNDDVEKSATVSIDTANAILGTTIEFLVITANPT